MSEEFVVTGVAPLEDPRCDLMEVVASLLLDNITREVVHQLVVLAPGSTIGSVLTPRCWELASLLADLLSDGVGSAGGLHEKVKSSRKQHENEKLKESHLRRAARALQLVLPAGAIQQHQSVSRQLAGGYSTNGQD